MNILFLGRESHVLDGGSIITMRNIEILKNFTDNLIELKVENINNFKKISNIILRNPLGYDKYVSNKINTIFNKYKIDLIFIDHSLLGGYSKILNIYKIPIITFFHNVEIFYYKEKMKIEGLINIPMIFYAKMNEKKAIKYSNYIITLTKRDSDLLNETYKRKADFILPTTFLDKYTGIKVITENEKYHLFVGSSFFANIEGIRWYIANVLDNINSKLIIIGKGFEFLNNEFPDKNFLTLGFINDLEKYYLNADFVINPVFSGSGMKTKTIEAFMYGKTVVGTEEAFVGIDDNLKDIAFISDDQILLISYINKILSNLDFYKNNQLSRNLFIKNFSIDSSINKFNKILETINE